MNTQQAEALKSESISEQMNVNDMNKQGSNYELKKVTEVEETPFHVVTTEKGITVIMGRYGIESGFESEEEGIEYAKKITWDKIMRVVRVMINHEVKSEIQKQQ